VTVVAWPAVGGAEFAQTCVLLLLHEQPLGRDELSERLRRVGLNCDHRWTGGALHALQELGLVWIGDDADAAGHLTPEGRQWLGDAADDLRSTQVLLSRFLARSGERIVAGSVQRCYPGPC
jgi:hypothetical protein